MTQRKLLALMGILIVAMLMAVTLFTVSARPLRAIAPGLGQANTFAVLGSSTVTNTGNSVINGDLGLYAGTSIIGFPPGIVVPPGIIHATDAVAQGAQTDVTAAYNNLAGQPCDFDLTGQDLGGLTLTPGVYCFSTSAQLTGTLTLNGQGNPSSVWVFQIGSTLTTAAGSSVVFINSGAGPGCNLFWKVGSSATLGTTTAFQGNILALASITMNTSASLKGRALASTAAVTLDNNLITPVFCAGSSPTLTPLAATQTAISTQLTGIVPTLTAIALTPPATIPAVTLTAIAATQTSIAATRTVLAPTLTAIAGTLAPSLTAQAATQTAQARASATQGGRGNNATHTPLPRSLPNTGFAKNQVTTISAQPAEKSYTELGDLWLEIPRLNVQSHIVGVTEIDGTWDVSWLGNQTGWLNGTTFPTWLGNSVLTAHVYGYDGKPGPFVHIDELGWGDHVLIHTRGLQYIYEVREVTQVWPGFTAPLLKKEDISWVTLITCRGYDQASNSYKYRSVVRAVLIQVK